MACGWSLVSQRHCGRGRTDRTWSPRRKKLLPWRRSDVWWSSVVRRSDGRDSNRRSDVRETEMAGEAFRGGGAKSYRDARVCHTTHGFGHVVIRRRQPDPKPHNVKGSTVTRLRSSNSERRNCYILCTTHGRSDPVRRVSLGDMAVPAAWPFRARPAAPPAQLPWAAVRPMVALAHGTRPTFQRGRARTGAHHPFSLQFPVRPCAGQSPVVPGMSAGLLPDWGRRSTGHASHRTIHYGPCTSDFVRQITYMFV